MKDIKLFLRNDSASAVELANGGFSGNLTGWFTTDGNWTYKNGRAYSTYGSDSRLYQDLGFTPSVTYTVRIKVKRLWNGIYNFDLGSVRVYVGDDSYLITSSGTYEFTLTPSSGTQFIIEPSTNFRGYVDNVVVESPILKDYVEIDLSGTDINLNFNIKDIEELSSNMSNYSQQFTIQGTKQNNNILEYLYDVDVIDTDFNYNIKKPAVLSVNELHIINGFFELSSAKLNHQTGYVDYTGTIYSNARNIVESMANLKMVNNSDQPNKDIDMSGYDHILDWSNIEGSWSDRDATTGYYYPIIDYGRLNYNIINIRDMRPALHVKEIWDKMFEVHGFTYTSDFIDSDRFSKLILPWTQTAVIPEDELANRSCAVGIYASTIYDGRDYGNKRYDLVGTIEGNVGNYAKQRKAGIVPFNSESETYNWNDEGNNFNTSTHKYTVPVRGKYNINYVGQILLQAFDAGKFASQDFYMTGTLNVVTKIVRTNGVNKEYLKVTENSTELVDAKLITTNVSTGSYAGFSLQVPNLYATDYGVLLIDGDEISVEIDIDFSELTIKTLGGGSTVSTDGWDWTVLALGLDGSTVKTQLTINATQDGSNLYEGDAVNMNQCVPDMDQVDFYKGIINMFNLLVVEDPDDPNNLIIEPKDDFYEAGEVVNWTELLDRSQDVQISKIDTLREKNFRLTYLNDDDKYNETYNLGTERVFGEAAINNQEVQTSEWETVELPFAMTPSDELLGTNVPIPRMYKVDDDGDLVSKTFLPRILNKVYIDGGTSATTWYTGWYRIWSDKDEQWYVYTPNHSTNNFIPTASHFDNPLFDTFDLEAGSSWWYYHNIENNTPTWNNLYGLYWKKTIDELMDPDSRKLKAYFKLDENTINNLRFNNTIIVDEQAYILSSINNWNPDQLTEVELIKLADVYVPATDEERDYENRRRTGIDDIEWEIRRLIDELKKVIDWYKKGKEINSGIEHIKKTTDRLLDSDPMPYDGVLADIQDTELRIDSEVKENRIGRDTRGLVTGTDNVIGAASRDFKVIGRSNEVGILTKTTLLMGIGNIVGDYTDNILLTGRNNTIADSVENATIIGGENITNDQDNTTIIGGVVKTKSTVINQPDIINGGLNEVQNPFSDTIVNILDGSKDAVRNLGSHVITTEVEGSNNV
jgi:hypothetical protein